MKQAKRQCKSPAQITIIVVIILAIFIVATSTICSFIFNQKYQIETKISQLSSRYYEDYFYPKISSSKEISEKLDRFQDEGFSKVSLRQLILSDPNVIETEKETLLKYCNENSTFVQFFPEPPYEKTSYRTEYTYSCSF